MGPPDEQLVEEIKATGENSCFAPIFERHRRRILGRCRAVVHDEAAAEDLTQDTFLTALARIELFRGGNVYAWLCAIARNLCLNYLEANIRLVVQADLSEEPVCTPDFEHDLAWVERLESILNQLSAPQRVCLKLFYVDRYTAAEVARITGFTGKQVKTYLQNGRRRFKILWEKKGGPR
ncbi:MAG: RNA polymerase sigma factor [Acidobacteriota bacterium]